MTDSVPPEETAPTSPPVTETYPTLPRERDAPRPLIIVMILACLLIVAAAYYAIEQSGMAGNIIGEPASLGPAEPIMELEEILEEREKRNLLGRDVALWRVPVDRVVGDYTFWIGSRERGPVPVVLLGEQTSRQPEPQSAINRGDTLAIIGTVRAVREVRHLDELWAMDEAEWHRIDQATIYISAIRVEHLARAEAAASPPDTTAGGSPAQDTTDNR